MAASSHRRRTDAAHKEGRRKEQKRKKLFEILGSLLPPLWKHSEDNKTLNIKNSALSLISV